MQPKKIIGVILVLAGASIAYYGIDQKNSIGSQLSTAFGHSNTNAIICIVGGVILALIGVGLVLKGK